MAGRLRVAAVVLGLVLLGGAVACGDDDSGDVSAGGTGRRPRLRRADRPTWGAAA